MIVDRYCHARFQSAGPDGLKVFGVTVEYAVRFVVPNSMDGVEDAIFGVLSRTIRELRPQELAGLFERLLGASEAVLLNNVLE